MQAWLMNNGLVALCCIVGFGVLAFGVKKVLGALIPDGPEFDKNVESPPPSQALPTILPPPLLASGEELQLEGPKCGACGDPATEPMPSIERGRGAHDWLRELFAMPPRYRRVVKTDTPALCRSHAHVADAMVDEFLHNRVRGAFTSAYTKVAVEAAGFEKEFLTKQLQDSLTDDQKKAAKRQQINKAKTASIETNGSTASN